MASFWCDNTLVIRDFKNKNLPKYQGATGGQAAPFANLQLF